MDKYQKPSIFIGGLVGGLLTAPLIAILYLGDQLAGLPFVPFDLFDWVARTLPGGVITFGIDTMVSLITGLNLGETSSTAKTAEQLMGLATFVLLGVVAGAIFFAIMNRSKEALVMGYTPGIVLGLIFGIPLIVISFSVNLTATASPVLSLVWLLLVFAGWGAAHSWVYSDLADIPAKEATPDNIDASVQAVDRRQFLVRVGGATAALTVIGAGLGSILGRDSQSIGQSVALSTGETPTTDGQGNSLPNVSDDNLQPAPGTRPEYTPLDDHYRIDISSRPPVINETSWTLPIVGLVENPTTLTLNDLRTNFEPVERFVTLSCISNRLGGDLISTTKWTGVPMNEILDLVQPSEDAVAIKITGADNFDEFVLLETIRNDDRIMLTYAWDDQPLKQKHGFPLRIYIPNRYGMKQPKWIVSMEFVDTWEEGYWVRRGWSQEAIVNTVSVVDTVAVDSISQTEEGDYIVPIGGIAYASAEGISKVEVSVNSGEWQEAQLRTPLSELTWVIWRYDWTFEEGTFEFAVRAYDQNGDLQSTTERGTRPDGATGIHSQRESMPLMEELQQRAETEE